MSFAIKTDIFEGPLELLLELIEKRKFFINDISLAHVADDYIAHIKSFEKFPLRDVAEFLLIASTLLLIKSKSLLPQLDLTPEEQADISDLEQRLSLYKKFQELGKTLRQEWGRTPLFMPAEARTVEPVFAPHQTITTESLLDAIGRVINQLPKKEVLKKAIIEKVMSLEDMIENLTIRIQESFKMSFKEFSGKNRTHDMNDREIKVNIIVSFLAMLELAKQGILRIQQYAQFQDIEMETNRVEIPRYS